MYEKRFFEYAEAFERAYASGDWSVLEEYFTEDATYEIVTPEGVGSIQKGRKQILEFFDWMTASFDKRFEERRLVSIDPPKVGDQAVELHGAGVYRLPSGERCHLVMHETAYFEDGRIRRLVDELTPGGAYEVRYYVEKYPTLFPDSLKAMVRESWQPSSST